MATTPFVQTPAQLAADAPVMGSIWTPGAVLACALCFGVRGGLLGRAGRVRDAARGAGPAARPSWATSS